VVEPNTSPGEAPAPGGIERRRSERHPCDLQPVCSEWGSGELTARLRDISTDGVGLVTPVRIRPGKVLVLKLQKPSGGLSRPILVRVIHSSPQPDGAWWSGGVFVRRLSTTELASLLQADQAR
jgi:hypothetical protein